MMLKAAEEKINSNSKKNYQILIFERPFREKIKVYIGKDTNEIFFVFSLHCMCK